ncbi:MAG TPA: NAD(P)/FAD-dependent oxidoreductase [Vicinamibacteria bacterium]|nr:NAD(P)/FAD-dependent oxidoreductase [Vicinamibacteria bacterium]
MSDTSLTIIGAGAVGLAIAARMAERFPDLILLERREHHGTETSSRNSEVIHAGMYYTPGSLKACLCVEGNRLLYEYCAKHDVPHNRLTKIIVAILPEEVAHLERILATGRQNGVELEMITGERSRELEPHVPAIAALFSPNTGVLSAHGLMDALLQEARSKGATFQSSATVVGLEKTDRDYKISIDTPAGVESFTSERVINAAGLECDTVAGLVGIDLDAAGYRLHYCKGSYFSVTSAKSHVVRRLVYPVPTPVSLGVHGLVDIAGRVRFGPDAEFLKDRSLDYRVDLDKRAAFAKGVRRLVPSLTEEDLSPDISGIRPKVQAPGEPARDFIIRDESDRGYPGLINLIGIESPGLTSCLAIARHVDGMVS